MSTLLTIKVTNPSTVVVLPVEFKLNKLELLDVYGMNEPCLVYCDAIAPDYSFTNVEDVFPGKDVTLKQSALLGIYPSKEVTRIVGTSGYSRSFMLSLTYSFLLDRVIYM